MKHSSLFARLYCAQGFLAGAYIFSLFALSYSLSSQESAARRSLALAAYTQKVRAAALSCRRLLTLSRRHGDIAQVEAARREASRRLAQSRSAGRDQLSPEESAELDKLSRFVLASGRLIEKIGRLKREGRAREASVLYETGLRPVIEQYLASSVNQRLREEQSSREETARMALLWTRLSLAAAAIFAVLTCLFFALWTRRLISYGSRNMAHIQAGLSAIRSGNFSIKIEPERADELGQLCTSLKSLAARLEQAQGRLDGVTQLASDAAHALNEVVFAAGEYVSLARQKNTLDAQDECSIKLILERTGRCNLLLDSLCERVAGQKLLSGNSPEVRKALEAIDAALRAKLPGQKSVS